MFLLIKKFLKENALQRFINKCIYLKKMPDTGLFIYLKKMPDKGLYIHLFI